MVKPRILITGFQRSGTTLTRRLIEGHPEVSKIFHEKRVIIKPNFSRIKKTYQDKIWGDKVPWNSSTGSEVIRQCKKWAKIFGDDHRIVHVMRNPKGAAQSNVRLGWLPAHGLEKRIKSSVIHVHHELKHFNYVAFRLEDLTNNPYDMLERIYDFCGLSILPDFIEGIIEGDPSAAKKVAQGIKPHKLPPYEGYKDFVI